jgi:hypothetical protein
MAYFNHAFNKVFLGGHPAQVASPTVAGIDNTGMLLSSGVATVELSNGTYNTVPDPNPYGVYGVFNSETYTSLAPLSTPEDCCPIIIASSPIFHNDKIGPFAGGYKETTKSKVINAKYVSRAYRVDPCAPIQNIVHVGSTPYTVENTGCCKDFLCDETYYLRLDIKGSPALRFLTRNSYYTADYYTGCCVDDTAPVAVDPTLVYIGWAKQFFNSPLIAPFIAIRIYDTTGAPVGPSYTIDTYNAAVAAGTLAWDLYVSPAGPFEGECAGMTFTGAYVDTVFGNCTFYPNDFYEKELVKILPSEVDYTGDPCLFTGICVVEECAPRQGTGFGDTALKSLILSESYQQNYFATNSDLRIREVTQGYDFNLAIPNRNAFYSRFYVQHNVPRFNNPTGVFDNDQYLLEIVVPNLSNFAGGLNIAPGNTAFETFMDTWLAACNGPCKGVEYVGCFDCRGVAIIPGLLA